MPTRSGYRRNVDVDLTPRQHDVLRLIAQGKSNPEIADALGIGYESVKSYVSDLFNKLGVDRREEAAAWWREEHSLRRRVARLGAGFLAVLPRGAGAGATAVALLAVGVLLVAVALRRGDEGTAPVAPATDTAAPASTTPAPTQESSLTATTGPAPTATSAPPHDTFVPLPDLSQPRTLHVAVRMTDGRVLVMGGSDARVLGRSPVTASVETYDPSSRTFSSTGSLFEARQMFAAVGLPGDRVLVMGGVSGQSPAVILATAELYDPATARSTSVGSMAEARAGHAAVLLRDGRVMVIGGIRQSGSPLSSTEVFDPSTSSFAAGPLLERPHGRPRALSLGDGAILVVGDGVAERWDPGSGAGFRIINNSGDLPEVPALLPDGTVLLSGGIDWGVARTIPTPPPNSDSSAPATAASVILDPKTGQVSQHLQMLEARLLHQATTLADGRVLVAGGVSGTYFGDPLETAEVFDPASRRFVAVGGMTRGRVWFTLTLLDDGDVLVVGVNYSDGRLGSDLYHP